MESALRTRDAVTLPRRAWAGLLRRLTGQPGGQHTALPPKAEAPAPALQLASGDQGLVLLFQIPGARCAALPAALAAAGYDVQVAQSLPAAASSLERRPPALVIIDGDVEQAAYRTLRGAGAFPILALIPQPTDEQVLAAFEVGVDDCQASGISRDELMARIHNMLRSASRQPGASVLSNIGNRV
jgi:PleD family two-component response regulator